MIGYVTLGTNDLPRALKFYDELMAVIGAGRVYEGDNFAAWGTSMNEPSVSIITPFDGNPATVGNGTMVALFVDSTEKVHALHAKAIELGGANEGDPGPRVDNFYAGYFRDLDGNKLNAFCMVSGEADASS
ncbi:MAG: VOC family protein [Woeseiaceae bacterium]|nr:VOC family protein [Woeseiaceae bacterium]